MNGIRSIRTAVAALAALALNFAVSRPAPAAPDFDDLKSETLTARAWKALGSQNLDDALACTAKCIELYAAEAKKMQEALKELPADEPKEETLKRWALNDVGTCLFLRGEVLLKKGDKKGAREAYGRLVSDFKSAQCWDDKGWFWKPAEAASQKLVELDAK